jgi:hypothetical protein
MRSISSATAWWSGAKHRARRGRHDVEFVRSERQCLGIALDPLQLEPARLRLAASGGKALRRDVERDDVRSRLSGADRDVSGSGRHVEHALSR